MGHMSVNHITRQFVNRPDQVDITGRFFLDRPGLKSAHSQYRGPNGLNHEGKSVVDLISNP
jgi:hypothetical protein